MRIIGRLIDNEIAALVGRVALRALSSLNHYKLLNTVVRIKICLQYIRNLHGADPASPITNWFVRQSHAILFSDWWLWLNFQVGLVT